MSGRTFFRIMIDNLFVNNALCKTILALVNFCNEQSIYKQKELKFFEKMPLTKMKADKSYQTRFIFNPNQNSGANNK